MKSSNSIHCRKHRLGVALCGVLVVGSLALSHPIAVVAQAARPAEIRPAFTCLFTYHDNLVTPQTNAVLPGSRPVALSGIGHLSLLLSRDVVGHVTAVLQASAKIS